MVNQVSIIIRGIARITQRGVLNSVDPYSIDRFTDKTLTKDDAHHPIYYSHYIVVIKSLAM